MKSQPLDAHATPHELGDRRIPTLDGWRGIAILFVLEAHALGTFAPRSQLPLLGLHGVQIFLVLSGYLITATLLREPTINLRAFYIRRAFRLLPAAWTYLIFLGLLTLFTPMHVLDSSIWSCLFSFRNYVPQTASNTCTMHFWSLSLEEQFYAVWPNILLLAGRKRAGFAATAGCALIAMHRALHWQGYSVADRFWRTEVRADALLIGCILALLLENGAIRSWFQRHGVRAFLCCLPILCFDFLHYDVLQPLHETIAIAICIGATSLNDGRWIGQILERHFIKTTGMASYSIYLWQGVFLRANWGVWGPVLLPIAFFICWQCIELPGIRFGRHIASRMGQRNAPQLSMSR